MRHHHLLLVSATFLTFQSLYQFLFRTYMLLTSAFLNHTNLLAFIPLHLPLLIGFTQSNLLVSWSTDVRFSYSNFSSVRTYMLHLLLTFIPPFWLTSLMSLRLSGFIHFPLCKNTAQTDLPNIHIVFLVAISNVSNIEAYAEHNQIYFKHEWFAKNAS